MTGPRAIMVVEDETDISEVIAESREDHGYAVILAGNGQEALDKLRVLPELPRLILLDLMMPIMDGREFRAAQTSDPALAGVPVVLLSAQPDVRKAATQMCALAWLKKPVDLRSLLEVVARGSSS